MRESLEALVGLGLLGVAMRVEGMMEEVGWVSRGDEKLRFSKRVWLVSFIKDTGSAYLRYGLSERLFSLYSDRARRLAEWNGHC